MGTDGASLIYTAPVTPSPIQSLIHSSLGIRSLLQKTQPLKHNVIDRDKIVVPPNWDSWGKIRVLREGFEVEDVSKGWSIDIDQPFSLPPQPPSEPPPTNGGESHTEQEPSSSVVPAGAYQNGNSHSAENGHVPDPEGSAVTLYESVVVDPSADNALAPVTGGIGAPNGTASRLNGLVGGTELETHTQDTQQFLAEQQRQVQAYKEKDARETAEHGGVRAGSTASPSAVGSLPGRTPTFESGSGYRGGAFADDDRGAGGTTAGSRVMDHIGPVQFNMGGIQVDADDMVRRLKVRLYLPICFLPLFPTFQIPVMVFLPLPSYPLC